MSTEAAFAVLVSPTFQHALTSPDHTLTLGRATAADPSQPHQPTEASNTPSFRAISTNKNISRKHGVIEWKQLAPGDGDAGGWRIACHSKNGLTVNAKHVTPENGAVVLENKDRIVIGDVTMFFICDPV